MATVDRIRELHAFLFITQQKLETGNGSEKAIVSVSRPNEGFLISTDNDFLNL